MVYSLKIDEIFENYQVFYHRFTLTRSSIGLQGDGTTHTRTQRMLIKFFVSTPFHLGNQQLRFKSTSKSHILRKHFKSILIGGVLGASAIGTIFYWKKEFNIIGHGLVRSGRTLFTALKISLDYRKNLDKWWNLEQSSDSRDPEYLTAVRACNLRAAQNLLKLFQKNAGIYIKLGQHLSALEYILPPEFCSVMAVLQNEAPESSYNDVQRVIKEDFGGSTIEDLFTDFDAKPIGAASLAQVHIAKLRETGESVAIKIQHHSIQSFAEVDMFTVSLAVQAVKYFFPEFQFDWLADEMRINLPKELDFIQEAHNSERVLWNFKQNSQRYPGVLDSLKIPKIMWKHTTTRVLTMENCPGAKITDLNFMHQNNIDPYLVSERLTQIFSEMIFIHGFVHCDPHPGNIFIRLKKKESLNNKSSLSSYFFPKCFSTSSPDWEIVVLDHGLYKEISNDFRLAYARLWKSLIEGDIDKIKKYCFEIGAGDAYRLFSSVLTHRTWSSVSVRSISSQTTLAETQLIKDRAPGYLVQVADLLANIPRPLLLLLKTNDLLRSIERVLSEPNDLRPVQSFFITAKYCTNSIYLDNVMGKELNFINLFRYKFDYYYTLFKINTFELLVKIKMYVVRK